MQSITHPSEVFCRVLKSPIGCIPSEAFAGAAKREIRSKVRNGKNIGLLWTPKKRHQLEHKRAAMVDSPFIRI
jgi:hypothetical protein